MRVCAARQTYILKYDCVMVYIISFLLVMDLETERIPDVGASVNDLSRLIY